MYRGPFNDPNERRVEPGELAKAARDKWLASVGGEEAYKRHMREMFLPSTRLLDVYVARWQHAMGSAGLRRLHQATVNERYRELRRLRRQLRLAVTLSALATGAALALVVFYGILGYH